MKGNPSAHPNISYSQSKVACLFLKYVQHVYDGSTYSVLLDGWSLELPSVALIDSFLSPFSSRTSALLSLTPFFLTKSQQTSSFEKNLCNSSLLAVILLRPGFLIPQLSACLIFELSLFLKSEMLFHHPSLKYYLTFAPSNAIN